MNESFTNWSIDHALVVHGYLLTLDVFATVVVIWGILWESNGALSIHLIARRLVIWGVIAEAVLTIGIFLFDEGISNNLQSKLAAYVTPRKLSQEQKDRIAHVAKLFPSVTFVGFTVPEEEPWELLLNIAYVLKANGWNWKAVPGGLQAIDGSPAEGMTIANLVIIQAPPQLREAAIALAAALKEPNIIGLNDILLQAVDEKANAVTIVVGSK